MSKPDTNQVSELYELCKEVYEKTCWKQEPDISYLYKYWDNHDELCVISVEEADDTLVPAYTSDYLLEKLPQYVIEYSHYYQQDISHYLCVMKVSNGYVARYDGLSLAHKVDIQRSETPLKALLKLTINLSEAGELKMTNQASEDELREMIERILRFNCPDGCDGNGSYPEMGLDGEWEQGQCQWCFEYGMPARDAIQALIRNEKLKLSAEVRERVIGEEDD